MPIDINEACRIAINERKKYFDLTDKRTRIKRIMSNEDFFIIDFNSGHDGTVYGGGGYIIDRSSGKLDKYCLPSYPQNILSIYYSCYSDEIPKLYK